jgi:hypothetical protein
MANNSNFAYTEILNMMREQGRKDNPITLQLGIMQSSNSVKIGDLILNAEDLYIADYLLSGYKRKIETPYVSEVTLDVQTGVYDVKSVKASVTKQDAITCAEGLQKGDLVAVQRLNGTNKYVILSKVVQAK